MKALENSSETTLQIQVPVFSYGKLSTITLAGQLIALTFVPTLVEIADPNVSANNAMARWLLEPLQVESDSDITSIPWTLHEPLAWSPDILTLISQSHLKSNNNKLLNRDNLGDALRDIRNRLPIKVVAEVVCPLSSAIKYAPPLEKFT